MKKMLTAVLVIIIAFITFSGIVSAGSTMSVPTSKVLLIYANGDRYEGDFINGMFHGKGIFIWARVTAMMVTFFLINELAKVSIYGQAAKAIKVILSTVSLMAGEYTPGPTVHIMKENLSTMNEGTVFISGQWMIMQKEKLKTINLAADLFFSGQKRIVN